MEMPAGRIKADDLIGWEIDPGENGRWERIIGFPPVSTERQVNIDTDQGAFAVWDDDRLTIRRASRIPK